MDKFNDFVFDTRYGIPILILILVFGCAAILFPMFWYDCHVAAEIMEVDYTWHFWSGCFFQTADGSYIHRDLYRGVEVLE